MCNRFVYNVQVFDPVQQYWDSCWVESNFGRPASDPDDDLAVAVYASRDEAEAVMDVFAAENDLSQYRVERTPVFGARGLSVG